MLETSQIWQGKIYSANEKRLYIQCGTDYFTDDDLTGKLELKESISTGGDIRLGSCISSELKFSLLNIDNLLSGIDFVHSELRPYAGMLVSEYSEMEVFETVRQIACQHSQSVTNICIAGNFVVAAMRTPPYIRVFNSNFAEIAVQPPNRPVGAIFYVGDTLYLGHDSEPYVSKYVVSGNVFTPAAAPTLSQFSKAKMQKMSANVSSCYQTGNIEYEYKLRYYRGAVEDAVCSRYEYVPLGVFRADSIDRKDEARYKIVAYDRLKMFEKDSTAFLSGLAYPVSLYGLTQKLCEYVSVELANASITNGTYRIEENFKASDFTSQQLLSWIGEVAASFICMDRYGKLAFRTFVQTNKSIEKSDYINFTVGDFTVPQVTRVQAAVEEDDLGVVVGSGDVTYAIINNPLLYTKTEEAIRPVVQNILTALQAIPKYSPVKLYCKGNPAIETGDMLSSVTVKGAQVAVLVMDRKFVYAKSFRDTLESYGTVSAGEKRIVQSSLIQLRGKVNILSRTLDKNVLKIGDLETGHSALTQEVDRFQLEITKKLNDLNEQLRSEISATADSITLSVNKKFESYSTTSEMNAAINIKANEITSTVSETYATKTSVSTVSQKADRIEAAVNSTKVTITEGEGISVYGGGLNVYSGSAKTMYVDGSGNVVSNNMTANNLTANGITARNMSANGTFRTGYITMSGLHLWISDRYLESGNASGGHIYFGGDCFHMEAIGWSIQLKTSKLSYTIDGEHRFSGGGMLVQSGNLSLTNGNIIVQGKTYSAKQVGTSVGNLKSTDWILVYRNS